MRSALSITFLLYTFALSPLGAQIWPGGRYTFTGGPDGSVPQGPVVATSKADFFYGTTMYGGAYGGGTIFRVSPGPYPVSTWGCLVAHSFSITGSGRANGTYPTGSLILDAAGNIYGIAAGGNSCSAALPNGCGVVYELSSAVTALYRFRGGADRANPVGGLAWDTTGSLYGVTNHGGTSNKGVIFKLAPPVTTGGPWTESVLYSFQPSSGAQAGGALGYRRPRRFVRGDAGGRSIWTRHRLPTDPAHSSRWHMEF